MVILNVCNNADILSALKIVNTIITIIKIIVPIILIVSVMITFVRAVKDHDDDALIKAKKSALAKLIAAILVFFIPTLVNIVADAVDVNKKTYLSCLKLATNENIDKLRYKTAQTYIKQAKKTLNMSDYNLALSEIHKLNSSSLRNEAIKELNTVSDLVTLKNEILDLKKNYDRDKHKELADKVSKITDKDTKKMLEDILAEVGKGRPLNLKEGLTAKQTYGDMVYYEVIPPNATTNMPLWIYLHGDGGLTTGGIVSLNAVKKASEGFFVLAPSPAHFKADWSSSPIPQNLKKLIDYIVDKYQIDEERIILSGSSRGAIGAWNMVDKYPNTFSVLFPISCPAVGNNACNFKTTVVRAHAGTVGQYEKGYASSMNSFVNRIKSCGGDATFTIHEGKAHGGSDYVLTEKSTIEFALSQRKKK